MAHALTLRPVLGDQLTRSLASLAELDPARDVVMLAEVGGETAYVPHHQQKLVLVLSAMRHFAEELRAEGLRVEYVRWDDAANTGTLRGEIARAAHRLGASRVVMTEPGEHRVERDLEVLGRELAATGVALEVRPDDRFFSSRAEFSRWARGRKAFRMEHFYREMRRKTGLLVGPDGEPEGGEWNYDAENRKRLPEGHRPPKRLRFAPDTITEDVMELVRSRFGHHPGAVERFGWGVTRADALRALAHFVADCLPRFGDYQDAMKAGEPFVYHALVSPYLNLGLLGARECCDAAVAAYRAGQAPLAATEGFVRQILGWREYVRGIYWERMPAYSESNFFEAKRKLPMAYWTGDTELRCLSLAVKNTLEHGYAHHIERLMILGNVALLAGVEPAELERWFLAMYVDAFEWVELPNVHGMALFADGGLLASKPYAASGAYVARMSDSCGACRYSPDAKVDDARDGHRACPITSLYWTFLERHRDKLAKNPRMAMPYKNLEAMPEARRAAHRALAGRTLATLGEG